MPGITYSGYPDEGQDRARSKRRGIPQSGHPPLSRVAGGQSDSYTVPPVAQTTAYGVNGPQWTRDGPPPLVFHRSPYARVPLPPLTAQAVTINPLLTPHGAASIIWTICQNPIGAACTPGLAHRDQYHWKALPATDSNLPSLTILIAPFPTPVVVLPARVGGVITVWDVLTTVYAGARRGAAELRAFSDRTVPAVQWAGPSAYSELAGGAGGYDAGAASVREYMGFYTRWVGLEPTSEPGVWVLRTKSSAINR